MVTGKLLHLDVCKQQLYPHLEQVQPALIGLAPTSCVLSLCGCCRFGACMLSTHLLLRLCCMPAKSAMGRAGADQVQQMLGSTVAGSAGSHLPAEPPASAFLKGSAAVPRSTLNQMPPQLLVGLFQELSSQEPQPQVSRRGQQAG